MTRGGRVGRAYLALFVAIYAVQGVVAAYLFTSNAIYLTSAGVARETVADVQTLALLPFVLKFLVGPLSDRFSLFGVGHRKPYIVLGLVLQLLGLLSMALVDPGRQLVAFAALAVLTVAGLGIYDTCCDGMIIDATPPGDRGRVQGMLVAARALAAMVCSYGFGLWVDGGTPGTTERYPALLWTCAALGVIPLIQAVFLPEPARGADAERFQWSALRVLVRPDALRLLAFGAAYAVVAYGVEINLSPYYLTLGIRSSTIGALGALRYVGRAAGGLLLGWTASRLGRRPVLALGILALGGTTAAQAACAGPVSTGIAALGFGAANGWTDALFYILAMEAADPRMAASTYALFMAVTNVSMVGGSIFTRAATALGDHDRPAFVVAGLAVLPLLLLVRRLGAPAPPALHDTLRT
jgi:PAT family beta-lactamase induction signal transducer AmpG